MSWSWRVGRVLGIDVYVHFTFLLLLGWVLLIHYFVRYDWSDALEEVLFITVGFGTILLHELGHAFAARHYGIPTKDITLLPIGGVARLERMPEDPKQELVVALAGPAVNVALAASLYLGLSAAGSPSTVLGHFAAFDDSLPLRLFHVNVWLVLFNLLPAFPMDGGRVLRALLALRLDYVQATRIAASVGQVMAMLFGFIGLFGNPLLLFIAFFVWIGASQEANAVQVKAALAGIAVRDAMIREFRTLAPHDTFNTATQHVLNGFQQDFPVLDDGRLVGVLSPEGLLTALAIQGKEGQVQDAMCREFVTARPSEDLVGAVKRLDGCACHSLLVAEEGELVGVVTRDNIEEFLMIRSVVGQRSVNGQRDLAG